MSHYVMRCQLLNSEVALVLTRLEGVHAVTVAACGSK